MNCPNSSQLAELLANADVADHRSSALWSHLETCRSCQANLDRLSDDIELTRWRRSLANNESPGKEKITQDVPACRDMVERLAKMDTSVDSTVHRETKDEETRQFEFLLMFTPSEFYGDLGTLGHYRIRRRIGQGGMAFVVEAVDTQLNRSVALKILRPELNETLSRERFLREAKAIAGVPHPNVIAIHGILAIPSTPAFISMELMAGGCLQERLRQADGIAPRQAAEWIAQIADGLSAAHQAGLIHRDIKPSNILLSDQDGKIAKLADFGLARSVSVANNVTQTGVLLGTPSYMSPEHILNPESVDARSDIYSLGVTLYETLTGEVPFRGALHTVLQRIVHDDPPSPRSLNPSVPKDLETICLKAMHREPIRRYVSASDFAMDLRRWLGGETILARPVSSAEKLIRWCRRKPGVAGLVGSVTTLLLVIALGSAYAALSIRGSEARVRTEKENLNNANIKIQSTADSAKRQRQLALESLNSLVTKVQTTLGTRPGTIELRSEILRTALLGLERITSDSESMQFDPTTIEAHIRQGEVLDLLGRTADAIVEFDKAVTLAEAAKALAPKDKSTMISLGNALMARGDAHRKAFAYDQAKLVYDAVLPIREQIADAFLEDSSAQQGLAICMQRIADLQFNTQDMASAAVSYERLLEHNLTASMKHPDDLTLKRSLGIAHERLGTWATTVGSLPKAKEHFEEAVRINTSLLESDPNSKLYKSDLAYFTKRLASLASGRGEHDEADRLANLAIEYYLAVANADPQDSEARMKVGAGWDTLYTVRFAAEKFTDAINAVKSGLAVFADLAKQYNTAAKYPVLAMEACVKLLDVQIRQGQFLEAAESMRQRLGFVENWQQTADAETQDFESAKAWCIRTAKTLELAAQGRESIDATTDADPDMAYAAKVLAAYRLAKQGEVDMAFRLCESLVNYAANDPSSASSGRIGLARTYAVCFRQLRLRNAIESSSPEDANQAKTMARCLEVVGSCVQQNPASRAYMQAELDLQVFATEPAFQALFQ